LSGVGEREREREREREGERERRGNQIDLQLMKNAVTHYGGECSEVQIMDTLR
jgi:hypothetical protein